MKIPIRRKYNSLQVIQLILLFLVSLNLGNFYFYFIFINFFVCVLTNSKTFKADVATIVLTLFSISYVVFFPPFRATYLLIMKQFAYPMCYLIGFNLFSMNCNKNGLYSEIDDRIKISFILSAFGTFLHYVLNASINMDSVMRNTEDFWTGEVQSATGQALLAVMSIGVFSVWMFVANQKWKKIVALTGMIAVFVYNFILAGRTILIFGVLFICMAFLFFHQNTRADARLKNYLFLCVIIVTALMLFLNNAWGIRDWILSSNLSNRFNTQEVFTDIRITRKLIYLRNILAYPFGGGYLKEVVGGYAHELYLDVLSDTGIIGYILVVAFCIYAGVIAVKVFKSKNLSVEVRGLILCVITGINIAFFLEPIMKGPPWFFCIYCFMIGVLRNSLLTLKKEI